MKSDFLIEVCVNSVSSGMAAEMGGADRIELCDNLQEGGTTPSIGTIKLAKEKLNIPVNVLIRPRHGDFLYSKLEIAIMLEDIQRAIDYGADGIVCGVLNPKGMIDIPLLERLLHTCGKIPFTFHRAFDMVKDPLDTLAILMQMKVTRILTSGLQNKAEEGADLLRDLVEAAGDQIIILPGSGIRAHNILSIAHKTKAKEFHVSGRKKAPGSMQFKRNGIYMGARNDLSEYELEVTDSELIREIVNTIQSMKP